MTPQESNSSDGPSSQPAIATSHVYKAIIAIGVAGEEKDVAQFVSLWVEGAEMLAHKMVEDLMFEGRIQLLPLPENSEEV